MVQSLQTLAKYKNTKGNNYKNYKIKNYKGNRTSSLRNRGQTKDFNKRRYLSGLYSRTSGIKKELA